jgi:hypothetical protein
LNGKVISATWESDKISALEVNQTFETEENTSLLQTTIATLASQTSFTLSVGSANNSAYLNHIVVVRNATTYTQVCVGVINAYVGATRTVSLAADPGIFTMAAGDSVAIIQSPYAPSRPEKTGAPGATISTADKIDWIYQTLRNRADVTAGAKTFYSDGGSALWSKALSDDGTTYSEAKGS